MDLRKLKHIISLQCLPSGKLLLCLYVLLFLSFKPNSLSAHRALKFDPSKKYESFQSLSQEEEKLSHCSKVTQKTLKLSKKYRNANEHNGYLQLFYRKANIRYTIPLTFSSYYQPDFFLLEQHCFLYRLTYF